jgi:hypothetical protein
MRPRITRLLVAPILLAAGTFAVTGCGGSSSTATSGEAPTAPTATASPPLAEAVVAFNDPSAGLLAAWAESVGAAPADIAAPSVLFAPGYTCTLVVTDTGVSLFLQEPGGALPTGFDWTKDGGVAQRPDVPASAPEGGTPCTLSDSWAVALK